MHLAGAIQLEGCLNHGWTRIHTDKKTLVEAELVEPKGAPGLPLSNGCFSAGIRVHLYSSVVAIESFWLRGQLPEPNASKFSTALRARGCGLMTQTNRMKCLD